MHYVYGLYNPGEGVIRYVGHTTRIKSRIDTYRRGNGHRNAALTAWLSMLRDKGHVVGAKVLRVTRMPEIASRWEEEIIRQCAVAGHELLNQVFYARSSFVVIPDRKSLLPTSLQDALAGRFGDFAPDRITEVAVATSLEGLSEGSHEWRKARRMQMGSMIVGGATYRQVADQFSVTTATVVKAVDDYRRERWRAIDLANFQADRDDEARLSLLQPLNYSVSPITHAFQA